MAEVIFLEKPPLSLSLEGSRRGGERDVWRFQRVLNETAGKVAWAVVWSDSALCLHVWEVPVAAHIFTRLSFKKRILDDITDEGKKKERLIARVRPPRPANPVSPKSNRLLPPPRLTNCATMSSHILINDRYFITGQNQREPTRKAKGQRKIKNWFLRKSLIFASYCVNRCSFRSLAQAS